MDKDYVREAVRQGNLVECTNEEYEDRVRRYLHEIAAEFIDYGDGLRATIALNEVKRLDSRFASVPNEAA